MPNDPPAQENTYVIDAESAAEMARLMNQDRIVTKGMGGLFSERTDLSTIKHILDIGCGPGGWALDVALTYPHIEVVGIDISQRMVNYANAQARVQGLPNVSFSVMDALKPLAFPENSFDLINARAIVGFMPKTVWPQLLKECLRITSPGGIIRLTEGEWGITNSEACEKLIGLCTRALQLAGRSFSPDGRNIGALSMLSRLLGEAGCQKVQRRVYATDTSAGTAGHEGFCHDFSVAFKLLQPFLIRMGLTTQEEVEQLYQQALTEMLAEDFCAINSVLTAWGQKPQ